MADAVAGTGHRLASALTDRWNRARAGDEGLRREWRVTEGSGWMWSNEGVTVRSEDDWTALTWMHLDPLTLRSLGRLCVEVTLTGDAEAAGLSLGPHRDFLTKVHDGRSQRMRLDLDAVVGRCVCTVESSILSSSWWDAGIGEVADSSRGCLSLKAHGPCTVQFQDLAIRWFDTSCRISVIVTCHRFLQRLRVSLRNWCHQDSPAGAVEIVVVNPASPDGTHEHLAMVSRVFPNVRVIELPAEAAVARNKGVLVNRAVAQASGAWIWLTDADCVFHPRSAALVLSQIDRDVGHPRLLYGRRLHLSQEAAEGVLAGRYDTLRDYDLLTSMTVGEELWPWGYTQIVSRSTFDRIRYDETENHFAHADGAFLDACQEEGIPFVPVPGLECLHLAHPFVWYGNDGYL